MATTVSATLVDKVADWLMAQALEDTELEALVNGCCERLSAAGVPLARANFSFSVLHPLYRAMGFTWRRGEGLEVEGYRHLTEGEQDRFLKSPYYYLLSNNLEYMRRRLDTAGPLGFPLLEELRDAGFIDYLAFATQFRKGSGQGMMGSWATDRSDGFSEPDIAALLRIQTRLAVAARMAVQASLAKNTLATYLGANAGGRVLDGNIKRGDGETIKAAIVIGDMRDSTRLAEELGRQAYIESLNAFFDSVASAFADAGGEILSFMGDGFLAIFPSGEDSAGRKAACELAFSAALAAQERMAEVNARRKADGLVEIDYGLGLHIGNVMFGNVGLEDRLAFSVFGAAVNEASRLESLTKTLGVPILASEEFRSRLSSKWLVLGEQTMRGVAHPITVYTPCLDEECLNVPVARRARQVGPSNAESVVLLQRERPAEVTP
ncbi:MAG: adenylate/guanylate cyclase domain-containing protein [Hyphomicrobiales bacterium]